MNAYESWAHGTSGQIEPSRINWGTALLRGWGLHLDGRIESGDPPEQTWVHFHIPLPARRPEAQDAPSVQKVMLRFATDCNKRGWFLKSTSLHGSQLWKGGVGGAVVRNVHVWDGDNPVAYFNDLDWQSDNLDTFTEQSVDILPEKKIHHGLGISVHVGFLNQSIVDEKIQPDSGPEYKPGWWDSQPFLNDDLATQSKRILLSSVGCRYAAKP